MELARLDLFGKVKAGHIEVRAPIFRAVWFDKSNHDAVQEELVYPTVSMVAIQGGNNESDIATVYLDEKDFFDRPEFEQLPLWCA